MKRSVVAGVLVCALLLVLGLFRGGFSARTAANHEPVRAADVSHLELAVEPDVRVPLVELGRKMPLAGVPREEAGSPRVLRVRCVDAAGRALREARISPCFEDGRVGQSATSDAEGLAELSPDDVSFPVTVVAQHPGHAAARKLFLDLPAEPVVLRLTQAATLEGVVELPEGPAGAGVTVLAVPEDLVLGADVDALLARPDVLAARSDAAGRFLLSGLDPLAPYELVAGGQGILQPRAEPVRAGEQRFVSLQVAHGYALHLRFLEGSAEPAHVERGFGSSERTGARLAVREATLVSDGSLSAQLALPAVKGALAANEVRFLAAYPERVEELGPLLVEARLPGYHPLELEFHMQRASDAVTEVYLTPLDGGSWGELEVRVSSSTGFEGEARRFGPCALLFLAGEDGTRLTRNLTAPLLGVHRLRAIPAGRYRVTLRGEPETFELPARGEQCSVTIGPETARLDFALEGTGAVLLDVRAPSGETFEGELAIALGRGLPRLAAGGRSAFSGRPAFFERPPYFLPVVEPGEYTVAVTKPRAQELVQSFTVVAGEATRTVLRLDVP